MIVRTIGLFLLLANVYALAGSDAASKAADDALDRYIAAFNARDSAAWASVLHFPYVSFADGQVVNYANRAAAVEAVDFETFADTTGWRRSEVVSRHVVQSSEDKVHLAARLARFNAAGVAYMQFDGLFVIERVDGQWGVRAYSRLAVDR